MMTLLSNFTPMLAELLFKGALVLAVALLFVPTLRNASAATRHRLFSLALVGLLILPLLVTLFPDRQIRFPAAISTWVTDRFEREVNGSAAATLSPIAFFADVAEGTAPTTLANRSAWVGWLVGLWSLGVIFLLLRLMVGLVGMSIITRRARDLCELSWWRLHAELLSLMGITRPVSLLVSASVTTPMTWGFWKPVVLLPAEAESWSDERRRLVLTHELAHVARKDWFWQMLSAFVCALHWVNPLAYLVARRLRLESEKASDDVVLRMGTKPSRYAELLLEFTRRQVSESKLQVALATSMMRPSQLGIRILSILGANHNRSASSRRITMLAGTLLSVGVGLLAVLQLAPRTSIDPPPVAIEQQNTVWWQLASGQSTQLPCGHPYGFDEPAVECELVALRAGVPGIYLLTVTPAHNEGIDMDVRTPVPDVAEWVELLMLEL